MTQPMPDAVRLPELARSLRAFGVARDAASEAAHGAVFTPLLDARARAAISELDGALSAFRGQPLAARIAARAAEAARAGESDPARARSRVALAREAIEPLRAELGELDTRAAVARESDSAREAWIEQLVRVFKVADVACTALARLLAEPTGNAAPSGWMRRFGR
jgi:hypothetical protein